MKHRIILGTKVAMLFLFLFNIGLIQAQDPGWEVNPANFAFNGEVTAQVIIGTVAVESGTLAAFYGEECRGVIDATQFPPTGEYIFTVMCFSNDASGETLTFKYYDPVADQVYDITETIEFVSDMVEGSAMVPLLYNAYIASTDATLSDLQVDGTTVSGFSADIFSYDVELAYATTIVPTVTAATTDANASLVVTDATALPGTTEVVVTAGDGVTNLTYSVNFTLAANTDATLSDLLVDGTTVSGFSADIFSYSVELPNGTIIVPAVTATTTDANASMVVIDAIALPGTTDVVVTADDGVTSLTYSVNFTLEAAGPTVAAPMPTQEAVDVVSIFSDTYTDLEGTNFNPFWNQSTVQTFEDIDGNEMMKYANFNYQGTELSGSQDLSLMEFMHVDIWTADATVIKVSPISGTGEFLVSLEPLNQGSWNTYDIPVTDFTGVSMDDIYQLKFDGQDGVNPSNIYVDNIYFYKSPTPPGSDATLSDLQVDGSTVSEFSANILSYTVELPNGTAIVPAVTATTTDVNASFVVTDATVLPGTTDVVVTAEDGATILTYSVNFTLAAAVPTVAAPMPTQDAADVVSIFSDTYTDLEGTDFNPGWGQTTVVTFEDIDGNEMMKYANFNYQGTELAGSQDLSSMEFMHVDIWTDDATVIKVTPISGTGEWLVSLEPINLEGWNSYDIPVTDFEGVSMDDIYQLKFDGQDGVNPSNIYVDNIYFYKSPTVVLDPPTDFMVTEDGYGTWVAPNNPEWTVNPANFAYNGEVTVQVLIETVAVESGTLAAFYGEECRGVIDATQFPVTGEYIFTVMCFSNDASGETLTFMYYDPVENQVYNITEDVDFVADMIQGTPDAPLMFNAIAGTTLDPIGYNLYLDGIMSGTTTDLFYQYLDLTAGQTYMGGVSALYGEGESVIVDYEFTVAAVVLDPPTDFMVTEDGYGTWVAPTGDAIGYNLYLDGLVVDNTEDLFYQYADLTAGETYMGGVSALYAEGESVIVDYEFTVQDGGCEGFDALTVGGYVAEQLGGMWTTWSGTPGSAEDAIVSDMYSVSPSNSILVEGTTDLVLMFAEENLTTGSYTFRNDIFIPTGTTGYWNLQKDVVIGEEWGFQVMYEDDMTMIVDAGAAAAAVLPYSYDTWYHNEVIVDLDNDWCEFFVDGNLIIGYQWTLGTFGDPGANTLGSSNFYANPGALGTPPGAHFDDVCFSSGGSITLVPPTDFMVTEEGYGTWVAPAGDPIVYNLYLDEVMVGTTTDLFYQYLDITAGQTYMGGVAAVYEGGESIIVEYEFSVPAVDPPTDFMVTEEGYGTWVAPAGDPIVYNLYLDEVMVGTTSDLFYQYADLTAGETYMGGVSAVYDEGESDIVEYEFTVPDGGSCENFDALIVGGYVAEQLGGMWTTWSGTPGTAEDAIVSDLYSVSPANSILVEGTTDLVLMFADENLTTGSHTFTNDIFIPTGTTGYWNLQKDLIIGVEWGFQIMYEDDMTMIVDAGAAAAAVIPYTYDTWYHNEVVVDLDNDWCDFYIDGELIIGYQWTLGTFGTPGANTLGSCNFFANPGAGGTPPGAHFDDVCFSGDEPVTYDPPTDLFVDNSGYATWLSPGSFNPEWIGYSTGEITNSIGTDAAADFDVAVRFTAADLAGFEDGAITKLNFVPGEDDAMCTYTLKVWVGAGEPTLVYSQELPTIVADQWNEIVLDTPVPFDNTEELWFGFNVNTTGGYPAGCDDGPQVEGFGNMMYWQGAWTTLTGLAPTLTFNWAVEGYVEVAGVEAKLAPIAQTTPSVIANVGTLSTRSEKMAPAAILSPEASRALMGYNVFLDGEYVDYTTDLFWQYEDLVDEHTYTAGVSAVYDNGESVVVDYEFMFGYVGVSEILENTISIFPNPATDNVNIQSEFNITDIYVYDYVGKVIYTIKDSNTKNVVLNTNSYGSGIYIVRIQTENGVVSTKRVIITK